MGVVPATSLDTILPGDAGLHRLNPYCAACALQGVCGQLQVACTEAESRVLSTSINVLSRRTHISANTQEYTGTMLASQLSAEMRPITTTSINFHVFVSTLIQLLFWGTVCVGTIFQLGYRLTNYQTNYFPTLPKQLFTNYFPTISTF